MKWDETGLDKRIELRPLIGLTRGLPETDLETIVIEAIHVHRRLVDKVQELFEALPGDYKSGKATGGPKHAEYIQAAIEMHSQMTALTTLLSILGYVPKLSAN